MVSTHNDPAAPSPSGEPPRDLNRIVLQAPGCRSVAEILVGWGFNCFRLCLSDQRRAVEILWSQPGFRVQAGRPSSSGIPILFPFPGRLAGTQFEWNGETYSVPAGDRLGNAIHGFVMQRPWRLIERTEDRAVAEFQAAVDAPDLLTVWPADFRLRADYRLTERSLRMIWTASNPDRRPLPCGLGVHPYFRLPLAAEGEAPLVTAERAADCQVCLPVGGYWELQQMLPTGRKLARPDAVALQRGKPFGQLQLDDVFSDLQFTGDLCESCLLDPHHHRRLRVAFDRGFRECVVFTPPHREAICIEPYTCVPNAMALQQHGVDAGLLVLSPGEERTFEMLVELA